MKSQTTTTEEDIRLPVAEQREPWTLPGSIFKPRAKESDARAFYDGAAVRDQAACRLNGWQACGSVLGGCRTAAPIRQQQIQCQLDVLAAC